MKKLCVPCSICGASDHYGTLHTFKVQMDKVVLRCTTCGGGWSFNKSYLPVGAPPELEIQACTNLIVNNIAVLLPPNLRSPDEETT